MGQTDALKRVRLAIVGVLDDNHISYHDDMKRNRPAIVFTINGQDRVITYSGGDPRAYKNARTQTRRTLQSLGVVLSRPSEAIDVKKGTASMDDNELNTDHREIGPPPVDETLKQPETAAPLTHIGQDYVVFSQSKYRQPAVVPTDGRFIAIELDRELIAERGHVLVIPLHVPNVVWDMRKEEFLSCFSAVVRQPERSEQHVPTSVQPSEPDVEPVAQPEVDQEPEDDTATQFHVFEEHPVELSDDNIPDFDQDEGVYDNAPAVFPSTSSLRGPKKVRRSGVSPQLGRVLVAMHHLKNNGQDDLLTANIQAIVSPVDAKQVSGMISSAIRSGYVEKGDSANGRASYYSLTKIGNKLAATLGTWPWDVRGLGYPEWLNAADELNSIGGN